ncbi:hypothetical protein TNIN_158071 [Trichonephila inaurata madagascariensis]|uniref:Uncharacterized protein n=1 Tax=Trichonephila inaurata madagascariensis TaxID=2747483 RepID=A0A8X6MEY3_9ARAC|nr:hypothetical protein TNIN_158071 [Trichonephila inaurata madagascariensis]
MEFHSPFIYLLIFHFLRLHCSTDVRSIISTKDCDSEGYGNKILYVPPQEKLQGVSGGLGGQGTKLCHSHQYTQSRDVKVHRLGGHEQGCVNEGKAILLESKTLEISTELREQPQLQQIQGTFNGRRFLSEENK